MHLLRNEKGQQKQSPPLSMNSGHNLHQPIRLSNKNNNHPQHNMKPNSPSITDYNYTASHHYGHHAQQSNNWNIVPHYHQQTPYIEYTHYLQMRNQQHKPENAQSHQQSQQFPQPIAISSQNSRKQDYSRSPDSNQRLVHHSDRISTPDNHQQRITPSYQPHLHNYYQQSQPNTKRSNHIPYRQKHPQNILNNINSPVSSTAGTPLRKNPGFLTEDPIQRKDQLIEEQRSIINGLEQKIKNMKGQSQLSYESQEKIKMLSECVGELRQKLRVFHLKYGKGFRQLDGKQDGVGHNSDLENLSRVKTSQNVHYSAIYKLSKLQQEAKLSAQREKQLKVMIQIKDETIQQQINNRKSEISKKDKEIASKQNTIQQMRSANTKLVNDNNKLQSKLSIFEDINDQLISTNDELRAEITELSQRRGSQKYVGQIQKLNEQLKGKDQKISELEALIKGSCENEERKSSKDSCLQEDKERERLLQGTIADLQAHVQNLQFYLTNFQSDVKSSYYKLIQIITQIDSSDQPQPDIEQLPWSSLHERSLGLLHNITEQYSNREKTLLRLEQQVSRYRSEQQCGQYSPTYEVNPQPKLEKQSSEKVKYLEESLYHLQEQFGHQLKQMKLTIEEKNELEEENRILSERIKELEDGIESPQIIKNESNYDFSEISKFNLIANTHPKMKKSKKLVSWADSASLQSDLEPKEDRQADNNFIKEVKSLKMINEMFEETPISTSETLANPQKHIDVSSNILVYICSLLKIPTKRSQYLRLMESSLETEEESKVDSNESQSDPSGEIILENVIHYLQNNSNAFKIQKLYMEVIKVFNDVVEVEKNKEKEGGLMATHQHLMQLLKSYRKDAERLEDVQEELLYIQNQLQQNKHELYSQKVRNSKLEKQNTQLIDNNEKIKDIISSQNHEIILYRLNMETIKRQRQLEKGRSQNDS